jgi:hypothetical protein
MKKTSLYIVILGMVLFSCTKKEDLKDYGDSPLIGTWNYSFYENEVTVFTRGPEFIDGEGIKFNANGTLLQRKNSGFCGTPPITYADYDGTWTKINDTIIEIKAGYWGGTITSKLDIEYISSYTLKFLTISSETVSE